MHLTKIFAGFLAGASLLALSACSEDPIPPPPTSSPFVALQDNVANAFNDAVAKLTSAQSYTMTGSLTSAAELTEENESTGELTSQLCPIEFTYADGMMYLDATDSNIDPHITYFDGERYYCNDFANKYYTYTNDHVDYGADGYLLPINSEAVMDPVYLENQDGTKTVSFEMPFNIYQSPALQNWIGVVFDNEYGARNVRVEVSIDTNGYITSFILSYLNKTSFDEDTVHQEVAVKMMLTNYNTAEITPPSDLSVYEDWSEDYVPVETESIDGLTPEDFY